MTDQALVNRMQLPRPEVTVADAAEIAATYYGLSGEFIELGSQQDRNFRLDTGEARYVLKICYADYATVELEAQNAALRYLRAMDGAPRVPEIIPTVGGAEIVALSINDQDLQIRLLSYVEGQGLTRRKHLPTATVAALGSLCARLAKSLSGFDHHGLDRTLQWDLRRAGPVAVHLLSAITNHEARDRIAKAMVTAVKRIQPLAAHLRVQPVHHDITGDNVVARPDGHGNLIPDGVIDFGDIIKGWVVGDLAVTCASLLHHADGDPLFILPAVAAYHAVMPLSGVELQALWPLIVARAVILVASSEQQLAIDPDNSYVRDNIVLEREIFEVATSTNADFMDAAILRAVGIDPQPIDTSAWMPLLAGIDTADILSLDLSTTSPLLDDGNWLEPDIDWRLLAKAASETGLAATRYGEFRLSLTEPLALQPPKNFALHCDVCLPAGTIVNAPFAGSIINDAQHLVLVGQDVCLHLDGIACSLEDGAEIAAGHVLGSIAGEEGAVGGLRVQLCRSPALVPPLLCARHAAPAWSALCPSPSALLGPGIEAPKASGAERLACRMRHLAASQKHYYANPPQIERGWREYLFDVEGRTYIDMINNVTILGHAHPRLNAAIGRQWSLLNTNSRFHYAAIADFSERLAALAPKGLDCVFLVNSGSEANDLALRLAWAYTGARNMLCLKEGYHGWSVASDAVSTSLADNPQALTTRPDWVHAAPAPNSFRGQFRGPDAGNAYLEATRPLIDAVRESGEGLAGVIAESLCGNAGGIVPPEGYLSQIYALVRDAGGLCIADEVQIGYGRLGDFFWGFEQQGVVPDIITIAKGMGNGHPLGAVITSRPIADALERQGYFFSSTGGSPVSSIVGMTVLDILEDEALQNNARVVGEHLKARMVSMMERFPLIGAVHGMGLYLGLELITDRDSLAPATMETAALCDRLLELGVIVQPTGDHLNVLKIKPPLCISRESAEFFLQALEKALIEASENLGLAVNH
ncbi:MULTISPECIES: aminotransferase [Rhizobium]|uniref:Aminotransferase n=1 Tax=Rhizobium rhododendri TaxID=2506430 RepID=A0ABY8IGN5_9HYPH|nr:MULTISPECIES: aminotransferase [Rhizobium]TQX86443.1 aminotransferase [Rhizobium sp. rho-13.1]TQY12362.1 aminotransferase [Rhizobium sp. rho-1.1]WFS22772.1 aminotransferase [Rhizobium rhododendri]